MRTKLEHNIMPTCGTMTRVGIFVSILALKGVFSYVNNHFDGWKSPVDNASYPPSSRQLLDFALQHPKPIGLLTLSSGQPVEIRDMITINSDIFRSDYFWDSQFTTDGERVRPRTVHPKGVAAWGYFEVLNDVSKYTKADVFNCIGKRTPVLARLSVGTPDTGGSDLHRDLKSISLKFYTKEGNLDLLSSQGPILGFKDPADFAPFLRALERNRATRLIDYTQIWDMITLKPHGITNLLYVLSDYGVPDGWRHMDFFPIHAYEFNNAKGERWYVKFNFRTEQGLRNLTNQQIREIQAIDEDYYIRDLYNNIAMKNYPSWLLELDIMSLHDVLEANFNPFEVTSFWPKGSYKTVPVGRLVLTRNSINQHRDAEQSAFNPTNLVPGIPGPVDNVFQGRRLAYRDSQNHRISRNHMKVGVNAPLYMKNYNRDGSPPVWDNGRDSPVTYPNSFHGPVPLVDDQRPKERLSILETNAVDLAQPNYFYNHFLKDDAARQRLIESTVESLLMTTEPVRSRALRLLAMVDPGFGARVLAGLKLALQVNMPS